MLLSGAKARTRTEVRFSMRALLKSLVTRMSLWGLKKMMMMTAVGKRKMRKKRDLRRWRRSRWTSMRVFSLFKDL